MQVQLLGRGPISPAPENLLTFTSMLIDATGEKAAFVGHVWWPGGRTGSTANIRRLGWRFGAVVKSSGSGLTASLQDVSLSAGPPLQPDGIKDQTVAVANGDAAFTSNGWYRSGALNADRTVAFAERLAVVIEYDAGGRLGSDSVNVSQRSIGLSFNTGIPVLFTSSWTVQNALSIIVLEFDDGTFGTLDGSYVALSANTHLYNSDSDPDEYAVAFSVQVPCTIDGLWASLICAAGADCEIRLYQDTTVLATATIDSNAMAGNSAARPALEPIPEQSLVPGTTYYIGVRPLTTNNVTSFSFEVADPEHFTLHDFGPSFTFSTRTDQGSWSSPTLTRRLLAGVRFASFADGNGMVMSRVRTGF